MAAKVTSGIQVRPYLSFKGDCEMAFKFYAKCLGGQLGELFHYSGTPLADQVPSGWEDKVMHGSMKIGELVLMGSDVAPDQYEEPKGISLTLQMKNVAEAERIFQELARDGKVVLPLEQTFWAERFGMVTDRFGIPWVINCGDS